jgi:phage repressor protein C with HTH and peptisase S24 domain
MMQVANSHGITNVAMLAKKLGYKSPEKLYRLERDENAKPSIDIITDFSNKFENIDIRWLLTGEEGEAAIGVVQEIKENYQLSGKQIRLLTVTVDKTGKELIAYVPVKAQAGYQKGFGDPDFVGHLPAFNLPILKEGTYRMFQVDGNSMLQMGGGGLHDGDIVIAQYVEDILSLRDNRVYVVVSTEGVLVKRCINRLKTEDQVLICNSDNKSGMYPPIVLHPHEILEVWELKAYISRQLSFSTDLWELLGDLQAQQAILQEKVNFLVSDQSRKVK